MGKNGKKPSAGDDALVEQTERNVIEAWNKLNDFNRENQDLMGKFAELADAFNTAWDAHKKVLKTLDRDSAVFRMSSPSMGFTLVDFDAALQLLGPRFTEYFDVKGKTDIIRNALKEGTCPGLEMVVNEVVTRAGSHTGPKQIELSALSWKRDSR